MFTVSLLFLHIFAKSHEKSFFYSRFSHAIAIAEGKFLQLLIPKCTKKTANGREVQELIAVPLSDDAVGEVNLEADDEDTEEEIEALVTEVEKALAYMPLLADSPVVELAATMLLKVHGFTAKVCYKPMSFTSDCQRTSVLAHMV